MKVVDSLGFKLNMMVLLFWLPLSALECLFL